MQSLFDFFYRYRILTTFVLMEVFCVWLIVANNVYQSAAFNSSNYMTGVVMQKSAAVSSYFSLRKTNEQLSLENKQLREELMAIKKRQEIYTLHTALPKLDSVRLSQYSFEAATVINSTVNKTSNFFTIDKGKNAGIQEGMGVMSTSGVAGKVKYCSNHFSTVVSVLNSRWELPAKIKRTNVMGFAKWKNNVPYEVELDHIGKHHKVYVGDTIVTSGYSASFPEGIAIGKVSSVVDDGKKFIIKIKLETDFTAMSTVYIIKNNLKAERDSVEAQVKMNSPN